MLAHLQAMQMPSNLPEMCLSTRNESIVRYLLSSFHSQQAYRLTATQLQECPEKFMRIRRCADLHNDGTIQLCITLQNDEHRSF